MVVVDDGSTDDTAAVARAHGVAVLSLPFNLGIGGALRTGFLATRSTRATTRVCSWTRTASTTRR